MDFKHGDTIVLPKKTWGERKQELQELVAVPHGLALLTRLYQCNFFLPEDRAAPSTQIMIARILSKEYPDG